METNYFVYTRLCLRAGVVRSGLCAALCAGFVRWDRALGLCAGIVCWRLRFLGNSGQGIRSAKELFLDSIKLTVEFYKQGGMPVFSELAY